MLTCIIHESNFPKTTESANFQLILVMKKKGFRWHPVTGLLLLAGGEYDDHREWVGEHLRHTEPLVRETALDVFLSNESSREEVVEQCNRSIADSCAAVVRLAKRKLRTLEV